MADMIAMVVDHAKWLNLLAKTPAEIQLMFENKTARNIRPSKSQFLERRFDIDIEADILDWLEGNFTSELGGHFANVSEGNFTSEFDEKSQLPSKSPENCQINTPSPESGQINTPSPENRHIDTKSPENRQINTPSPEMGHIDTKLPEMGLTAAELPKWEADDAKSPEIGLSATKSPEMGLTAAELPKWGADDAKSPEKSLLAAAHNQLKSGGDIEDIASGLWHLAEWASHGTWRCMEGRGFLYLEPYSGRNFTGVEQLYQESTWKAFHQTMQGLTESEYSEAVVLDWMARREQLGETLEANQDPKILSTMQSHQRLSKSLHNMLLTHGNDPHTALFARRDWSSYLTSGYGGLNIGALLASGKVGGEK